MIKFFLIALLLVKTFAQTNGGNNNGGVSGGSNEFTNNSDPYMGGHGSIGSFENCDARIINKKINLIESKSYSNSVYDDALILKETLHGCGSEIKKFGLEEELLKTWIRRGDIQCYQRSKTEFAENELFTDEQFSLAHAKIENWKKCADRIGVSKSKDFIAEYKHLKKQLDALKGRRKKQCSTIDLSNSPGLGPVRDQGDIGWCFANAAADFASFQIGKKISAVDIAMNEHDGSVNRFFQRNFGSSLLVDKGGSGPTAIENMQNDPGFCLEENFRSDDQGKKSLLAIYRELESHKTIGFSDSPRDLQYVYTIAKKIAPKIDFSSFRNIYVNSRVDTFFKSFRDLACQPRIKFSSSPRPEKKGTQMDQIQTELDNKKIVFWGMDPMCAFYGSNEYYGLHETLIVGRRFNETKGVCEFKVRNSWSTSWGDNGHMWVDEERVYSCSESSSVPSRTPSKKSSDSGTITK